MASEGNFEVSFRIRRTISFKFETRFIKPLVFLFLGIFGQIFSTQVNLILNYFVIRQQNKVYLFIYYLFIFRFHLEYNTKRD